MGIPKFVLYDRVDIYLYTIKNLPNINDHCNRTESIAFLITIPKTNFQQE